MADLDPALMASAGTVRDAADASTVPPPAPPVAWWLAGTAGWAAGGATGPAPRLALGGRDLRTELMGFVGALRARGLDVPTDRVLVFLRAAATLAPPDLADVYWAGRATLLPAAAARPAYDDAFAAWFVGATGTRREQDPGDEPQELRGTSAPSDESPGDGEDRPRSGAAAGADEVLRHRRFDRASEDELAAMRRVMERVDLVVPRRATRRTRPARTGRHLDVRRSVRHAVRTDGEVLRRVWRRRRTRRRPLVIVLDVSGSMAHHSRALLQFAFSARVLASSVEVFAFATRLTRLTRALDTASPDDAMDAAAREVRDWDSGTRIGDSLDSLHRRWGRRGILRGAVVLVVSDGLERGDVETLGRAMARLRRQAHAVVWINPLKGDPRYEPLARGMAAALPHVDRLVTGHDLASLEALADLIVEV